MSTFSKDSQFEIGSSFHNKTNLLGMTNTNYVESSNNINPSNFSPTPTNNNNDTINSTLTPNEEKKSKLKNYLNLKFSNNPPNFKSILKNLDKDILDFQELNRDQVAKNQVVVEKILRNINNLIKTFFVDIDLLVFGSYSTVLCLTWSDIDLVLVNKSGVNDPNILKKVWSLIQLQPWKKSCILVENTTIPVLKIVTTESLLNMHIDISVQDSKHFGLKCVELVKMYIKEYDGVLKPIVISLKNILKCAGLNDPYKGGLSSYGLTLLVVSYLQNQLELGKNISKEKYNLGRLFIEFLYYYGVVFDPSEYIVYSNLPGENFKDNEDHKVKYFIFYLLFLYR